MEDLNVFSKKVIGGGEYNHLNLYGSCKVTGDIKAESADVFGSARFEKSAEIKKISVKGACKFLGPVKTENMSLYGSTKFEDEVSVKELTIYGATKFFKKVHRSEKIMVYGAVKVDTLEADYIRIQGAIHCKGELNADKIEINSDSNNNIYINEMVGEEIICKKKSKLFSFRSSGKIQVNVIEGDKIYLENVEAKVVRGKHVKIGPDCVIDHVEYQELEVSSKSAIKSQEKI